MSVVLNIEHERISVSRFKDDGTVIFCPHVILKKFCNISGGPDGGFICGSSKKELRP